MRRSSDFSKVDIGSQLIKKKKKQKKKKKKTVNNFIATDETNIGVSEKLWRGGC